MKTIQTFLILFVLIISGCQKDTVLIDNQYIPIPEGELVSSKLIGQVVSQAGFAIFDATVKLGQSEATTNRDGVFSFASADLELNGQLLTIEKEGFYTSYKKIIPTKTQTFTKVALVTKSNPTGEFIASEGGIIAKPNGEKITFLPNSIRTDFNEDYEGTVTVYTHHFNPEEPYFHETMPGDLSAIDNSGNPVQLATYSMVLVELFGEDGEILNLKPGKTATMEFPIKGAAANNAPEIIPLWSLDENTGTWVEESQATKHGDSYIGEVAHFSFWNCDVPFPVVKLNGTLVHLNGNIISNQKISIETVNGGLARTAFTNNEGKFSGGIPKDEPLIFSVLNFCEEEVFSQNIGPFSTDQDITFTTNHTDDFILISGSVKNCSGDPVDNGYAVIETNTSLKEIFLINSNGNFGNQTTFCQSADFKVYGVDLENLKYSPEVSISNNGQNTEDVGVLLACDELDTYISVSVNNVQGLLLDESAEHGTFLENNNLEIAMQSNDGFVFLTIPNPIVGLNNPSEITIEGSNLDKGCDDNFYPCIGNFTIDLSKVETYLGGYIEGTANGNLSNGNGEIEPVTMEFRVRLVNILSSYSGIVWEDLNNNGIRDMNELGLENIFIEYRSPSAFGGLSVYQEIFSNSDGTFTVFVSELNNGILEVHPPTGYITTLENQGNDESLDSDFPQGESEKQFPIEGLEIPNLLDVGIHLE